MTGLSIGYQDGSSGQLTASQLIQRRVGIAQREALDMRMDDCACGEIKKCLAILACEIGDRTDDALTPQQGIGHGWNIAHMNAAKDHYATFPPRRQVRPVRGCQPVQK